MLFVLREIDPN